MSSTSTNQPPRIAPVDTFGERPLWSVMVPVYNPPKEFLAQALRSVLEQDPGAESMEMVVVDDCSPAVDVGELVAELGGGRVGYARTPENFGLAGCWNHCIELARGEWIHLLHQDDYVLPGFYKRLREIAEAHPEVSLIATRSYFVDEKGVVLDVSKRLPKLEGGTKSGAELYYETRIQCPGVVVRRSYYEQHGGFRRDLSYTLDVEMWTRAIGLGGGVVTEEVLACYRRNSGNETSRLWRSGEALRDIARLNAIFEQRYPDFDPATGKQALLDNAQYWAETFARRGDTESAKVCEEFWNANAGTMRRLRRTVGRLRRRLPGA